VALHVSSHNRTDHYFLSVNQDPDSTTIPVEIPEQFIPILLLLLNEVIGNDEMWDTLDDQEHARLLLTVFSAGVVANG